MMYSIMTTRVYGFEGMHWTKWKLEIVSSYVVRYGCVCAPYNNERFRFSLDLVFR
jgi:hypothetical protein